MVAREESHAGGFDGRNDEARSPGGNLPERGSARLLNLSVWREILKRQHIVRGQTKDGVCGERSGQLAGGEDGGVQCLGSLVVGDQNQTRRVSRADEKRKIQRAGCKRQSRHTSAPCASTQMAAHTLERHRVFKVRKQFADEGQNHC